MSSASQIMAGILLITVLAVEFGGLALLTMLTRRIPGYLDNPLRQNMFRAGHAHAGVWVVFALVALLWVDQTDLRGAVEVGCPAGIRGGTDSHAAGLLPVGYPARRRAAQRRHRAGLRGRSRPCGRSGDTRRRPARFRIGIG